MPRQKELKGLTLHPMASKAGYEAWKSRKGLNSRWAGSIPKKRKSSSRIKSYGAFRLAPLRRSKGPHRY